MIHRSGGKSHKLALGAQAKTEDLVSIFATGPDIDPSTVAAQESFYRSWIASLKEYAFPNRAHRKKALMEYTPSAKTKLVYALMGKRISEAQFFQEFPATRETIHAVIAKMLALGLAGKDTDLIEGAIPLAYRYGILNDYLPSLNALALEPWHFRHEDVVFALGKLKDPSSTDVLSATAIAEYPYLEDDEAFALGTKSIYALENIGTPEAIRKIGELAESENAILKATAINRIKNTVKKSSTEEIKSIAQSFLNT